MMPQFQEADQANQILPLIKDHDSLVLINLIRPLFKLRLLAENKTVIVSDLGCGEGQMLNTLLNLLHDNLENYLTLKITIYGCEPSPELHGNFIRTFTNPNRPVHLQNVEVVEVEKIAIENYQPKKSDLFLFSHSLYYMQTLWNTSRFPNIQFNDHLLTRYLNQLNDQGLLCVILQSAEASTIEKNGGGVVGTSKAYEEFMYPIIGRDTENLISSEDFLACYREYQEHNPDAVNLDIQNANSTTIIQLGNVNFDDPDPETGKYIQLPAVNGLLNFYTRGQYNNLSADDQRRILDYIRENCITTQNATIMCHLNRMFVIAKKEVIPVNVAEQQTAAVSRFHNYN